MTSKKLVVNVPEKSVEVVRIADVKYGEVFKIASGTGSYYLRTEGGFINLTSGTFDFKSVTDSRNDKCAIVVPATLTIGE